MALLGGVVAAGSHVTKAGTRVAANTSPEPFSNWFLSLAEDAFVIGLSLITLKFPLLALGMSVVILLMIVLVARKIWKWLRSVRSRQTTVQSLSRQSDSSVHQSQPIAPALAGIPEPSAGAPVSP